MTTDPDVITLTDGTTRRVVRYRPLVEADDGTAGDTMAVLLHPSPTDSDHVTARVLNAAMDWENTLQRHDVGAHDAHMHSELLTAAHNLRAAIRSYMPLVTT